MDDEGRFIFILVACFFVLPAAWRIANHVYHRYRKQEPDAAGLWLSILLQHPCKIMLVTAGVCIFITFVGFTASSFQITLDMDIAGYLKADTELQWRLDAVEKAVSDDDRDDSDPIRRLTATEADTNTTGKNRVRIAGGSNYWKLDFIYRAKDASRGVFTEDAMREIQHFELAVRNQPEFNEHCQGWESVLEVFFGHEAFEPWDRGELTDASMQEGALELARRGDVWWADKDFSASEPTSEYTRSHYFRSGEWGGQASSKDWLLKLYDDVLLPSNDESPYRHIEVTWYERDHLFPHEVVATLWHDLLWSIGSFAFVFAFLYVQMWSVALVCAAAICVLLAFSSSFFFVYVVAGYKELTLLDFISVFLVLGIAADNVLVMYHTFRLSKEVPTVNESQRERMKWAYNLASKAMFVTSATTCGSFYSLILSTVPIIRKFGFLVGTVLALDFVLVISFFPACLLVTETVFSKCAMACQRLVPCNTAKQAPIGCSDRLVRKAVAMTIWRGRFFLLVITVLFGSIALWRGSADASVSSRDLKVFLESRNIGRVEALRRDVFTDYNFWAYYDSGRVDIEAVPIGVLLPPDDIPSGDDGGDAGGDAGGDPGGGLAGTSSSTTAATLPSTASSVSTRPSTASTISSLSTASTQGIVRTSSSSLSSVSTQSTSSSEGSTMSTVSSRSSTGTTVSPQTATSTTTLSDVETSTSSSPLPSRSSTFETVASTVTSSSTARKASSSTSTTADATAPTATTGPSRSSSTRSSSSTSDRSTSSSSSSRSTSSTASAELTESSGSTRQSMTSTSSTASGATPVSTASTSSTSAAMVTTRSTESSETSVSTASSASTHSSVSSGTTSSSASSSSSSSRTTTSSSGTAVTSATSASSVSSSSTSGSSGSTGSSASSASTYSSTSSARSASSLTSRTSSSSSRSTATTASSLSTSATSRSSISSSTTTSTQGCLNDCSGYGACIVETLVCRCYVGHQGDDCSERAPVLHPLDSCIEVSLVWGITGHALDGSEASPVFNTMFNLSFESTQEWLLHVVKTARSDEKLYVRDDQIAWIEDFEKYTMLLNLSDSPFPVPADEFAEYLEGFTKASSGKYNNDFDYPEAVETPSGAKYARVRLKINVLKTAEIDTVDPVYNRWDDFAEAMNAQAPADASLLVVSKTFAAVQTEKEVVDSTARSFMLSTMIAFFCLVFFSGNIVTSVFAVLSMGLTLVTLFFGLVTILGWKVGPVQAMAVTILVGMSIDYSFHMVTGYQETDLPSRRKKARAALARLLSAIVGGAVTTMGAVAFLFPCWIYLFVQLGIMIFTNSLVALLYTVLFLVPLLMIIGPVGRCGNIYALSHCISCSKEGDGHESTAPPFEFADVSLDAPKESGGGGPDLMEKMEEASESKTAVPSNLVAEAAGADTASACTDSNAQSEATDEAAKSTAATGSSSSPSPSTIGRSRDSSRRRSRSRGSRTPESEKAVISPASSSQGRKQPRFEFAPGPRDPRERVEEVPTISPLTPSATSPIVGAPNPAPSTPVPVPMTVPENAQVYV